MFDPRKTINVTKTILPSLSTYSKYLEKIWDSGWITNNGDFAQELERKLANFLDVKNLTIVSNGTVALDMIYKAMDLKGDVVTTAFTFPATVNSLVWNGLKPIFVDIDRDTYNIDASEIERKITKKTSAILGVHVFGNPCEVEKIQSIAKQYELKVIYDSAHAFGVEYKNRSILNWGNASMLSFHAAKVFHTIEGGGIVFKNKLLSRRIKLMRNHGIEEFGGVKVLGTNAKINELEAAMGLCVLGMYEKEQIKRRAIYQRYYEEFKEIEGVGLQKLSKGMTKYNYPYFPICLGSLRVKNNVYKALLTEGIYARKYFYPPCYKLPYLKEKKLTLKNTEYVSNSILCLPLHGALKRSDVEKIISIILKSL